MKPAVLAAALGAASLLGALAAHAGPPLLCNPMEIGDAPSLPWHGGDWKGRRADYDRAHLADDTVARLGPDVPVIVRMETLRRAALYAATDARAAQELLARLEARAAQGKDSLALFDAGYLSAAYAQVEWSERPPRSMPRGAVDPYERVQAALAGRGSDPEMEYAVALLKIDGAGARPHLARAAAGAREGSPLARTLAAHQRLWDSMDGRASR